MILGLDPSLANFGWALAHLNPLTVVEAGVIKTKPANKKRKIAAADAVLLRVQYICETLLTLIDTRWVDFVCAEMNVGGWTGLLSARAWGLTTGMIAAIKTMRVDLAWEWFMPEDLKRAATGDECATKVEVQHAMRERWPKVEWPKAKAAVEHAADAAAVICAAEKYGTVMRVK